METGIKNVAGSIAFAGGVYAVYRIVKDKKDAKTWDFYLKISCICSALVSPVGLKICSCLIKSLVGPERLPKSEIFAVNPWQPRHVASLLSNGFALLGLVKLVYERSFSDIQAWVIFNFFTGRPFLHIANGMLKSQLQA